MSRRAVLTAIWWIWGVALFLILIALTLQTRLFGDDTQKVWQWFLPNIVPAMTMVGFTAYAAPAPQAQQQPGGLFAMAAGVSCVYLALLTLSVVGTLFSAQPLQFMTGSSLWLAPMQGFAVAGLSVFFVKAPNPAPAAPAAKPPRRAATKPARRARHAKP